MTINDRIVNCWLQQTRCVAVINEFMGCGTSAAYRRNDQMSRPGTQELRKNNSSVSPTIKS